MNREIKFEYCFQSQNGIVKKVYDLAQIPRISQICDVWNELPVAYVRQSTALKDKNGFEIYEGDIVVIYGKKAQVIFLNGSFKIVTKNTNGDFLSWRYYKEEIEIIGNIYEYHNF